LPTGKDGNEGESIKAHTDGFQFLNVSKFVGFSRFGDRIRFAIFSAYHYPEMEARKR
jgi:hypothetical protein